MILAIDQGTTGTTCLVFDSDGRVAGRAYSEFEQHFPRPGWVEHDANEIWEVTRRVAGEALEAAGANPGDLQGIGIANQRETVVAWDVHTGEPLHRAIVYHGSVPSAFRDGRAILIDGKVQGAAFSPRDDTLSTKCPSKYSSTSVAPPGLDAVALGPDSLRPR